MAGARAGGADERPILAVGELLAGLKGLIEHHVGRVFVVGEISNLHQARSGHSYFTLKDETGQIRAALFRGNARQVRFELEEGLEQRIAVGPMAGKSNAAFVLERMGIEPTEERVQRVLAAGKSSKRLLNDAEVRAAADG